MNKIGAETTITVYWFAILVIVTGAVVYMVSLVYGQPYDVREAESEILANNIADCLAEGGYLREKTLEDSSFNENFLGKCNINLETLDFPESRGEYYVEATFYDFDTGSKIDFEISKGNVNLKQNCEISGKKLPICSKNKFYAIDEGQKSYRIEIIAVVNKVDKNVQ